MSYVLYANQNFYIKKNTTYYIKGKERVRAIQRARVEWIWRPAITIDDDYDAGVMP